MMTARALPPNRLPGFYIRDKRGPRGTDWIGPIAYPERVAEDVAGLNAREVDRERFYVVEVKPEDIAPAQAATPLKDSPPSPKAAPSRKRRRYPADPPDREDLEELRMDRILGRWKIVDFAHSNEDAYDFHVPISERTGKALTFQTWTVTGARSAAAARLAWNAYLRSADLPAGVDVETECHIFDVAPGKRNPSRAWQERNRVLYYGWNLRTVRGATCDPMECDGCAPGNDFWATEDFLEDRPELRPFLDLSERFEDAAAWWAERDRLIQNIKAARGEAVQRETL